MHFLKFHVTGTLSTRDRIGMYNTVYYWEQFTEIGLALQLLIGLNFIV